MVIPNQYPHLLEIYKQVTQGHENDNGDWIPGTSEWISIGKCRVEVAKQNAFKTSVDGTRVYYFATVYAPLPKLDVKAGDNIRVTMGIIIQDLNVKMVDIGSQLNNRIWV